MSPIKQDLRLMESELFFSISSDYKKTTIYLDKIVLKLMPTSPLHHFQQRANKS